MDIEITPSDVMDIPSSPEEERLLAQAEALNLPVWNETPDGIAAVEFAQPVPLQFLRRHRIVPLVVKGKTYIAANDLTLFESVDDLKRLLKGSETSLVLAPESAILSAIDSLYNLSSDPVKAFVQTFSDESYDRILSEIEDTGDLLDDAHEAPMIQLVNLILSRAIRDRASDIHIEPYQNSLKIRYRIDGMLSIAMDLPRKALWLYEQVNHPYVKLNFDISHTEIVGMPTEEACNLMCPHTVFTHVKDQRGLYPNHEFLTPGAGPFDYVRYLKAMHAAGYTGFIGMEVSVMVQRKPGYDPLVDAALGYYVLRSAFNESGVPLEM